MSLYLDTAYVAKCYVNEADAAAVRAFVRGQSDLVSSALARAELACVLHRHVREGGLTRKQGRQLHDLFRQDVDDGVWNLVPLSTGLLAAIESKIHRLGKKVFVRAGDVIHLMTAAAAGFSEVWTSDRHMLAAAVHFGLRGRSV